MLRAAGATGRQVFRADLRRSRPRRRHGSAAGVVLGIGAAIGMRDLIGAFGIAIPDGTVTVLPGSLLTGFALGVLVTVPAATGPSRRAARVAPLEAMRDAAREDRPNRVRVVAGQPSRRARWSRSGPNESMFMTRTGPARA